MHCHNIINGQLNETNLTLCLLPYKHVSPVRVLFEFHPYLISGHISIFLYDNIFTKMRRIIEFPRDEIVMALFQTLNELWN